MTQAEARSVIDPHIRAKRLRDRLDAFKKNNDQWPEVTLALATELFEARKEHESNKAFGLWLAENELDDLGHQDRAALINIGEHPNIAGHVLRETMLRSVQRIWTDEIKPRLTTDSKTAPTPTPNAKPTEAAGESAKSEPAATSQPKESTGRPITARSAMAKMPRGVEVAAIYSDGDTRGSIGRLLKAPGCKKAWDLILQAIDAGFAMPTDTALDKPTVRLLFTQVPPRSRHLRAGGQSQLDLSVKKDRTHVEKVLLPAALANREAIIAEPHRFDEILDDYAKAQQTAARKADMDRKRAAATARMKADEREIIVYGETLWPDISGNGNYDYDQARIAAWIAKDQEGFQCKEEVKSRALIIRLSVKWFSLYAQRADEMKTRKVCDLVELISRAFEKNPSGECKWPDHPVIEGQW